MNGVEGLDAAALGVIETLVTDALSDDPATHTDDLVERARQRLPLLDVAVLSQVIEKLAVRATGLGRIEDLLHGQGITEVMVNGPGPIWIDRDGGLEQTSLVLDHDDIAVLIERMLDPLGLRVDPLSPTVDARLPDGSRVNVVVPPVAVDGPVVTLRRFAAARLPLDSFGPPDMVAMLERLVEHRSTVLVVGGTGAGKTTLLNALAGRVPPRTRIVTVEDTAELQLPGDHVVRLESRPPSREGVGEVTLRTLVRNALRMRPDRLIVGEVRGGEAFDLLLALNTGHAGSFTTCHANSAVTGLRRLETLALLGGIDVPMDAVRRQMLEAIDVVILVDRSAAGRRVVSIEEVDPDHVATRRLWPQPSVDPVRPRVRRAVGSDPFGARA